MVPPAKTPAAAAAAPAATDKMATTTATGEGTYFLVRPERMRWGDMLRLLLTRRKLREYPFVEIISPPSRRQVVDADQYLAVTDAPADHIFPSLHKLWGSQPPNDDDRTTCDPRATILLQFIMSVRLYMRYFKTSFEFFLNLVRFNGNDVASLVGRVTEGRATMPTNNISSYQTIGAFMDPRIPPLLKASEAGRSKWEMAVLASKIAYENEAYCENVVINHLGGREFEFFNCWNEYVQERSTQAIGFVRDEMGEDGRWRPVVYVAFRGTEFWDSGDWAVNLDCGQINVAEGWGWVHKGFLAALGGGKPPSEAPRSSFDAAFPADPSNGGQDRRPRAFPTIRKWVTDRVTELRTAGRSPWVRVVGHSQGGALAILFVALLELSTSWVGMPERVEVITQGQPRVGDETFADKMASYLRAPPGGQRSRPHIAYTRMVYRNDLVARIPFSYPQSRSPRLWKHFGTCLYYDGWRCKGRIVKEMPNENYNSLSYDELLAGVQADIDDAEKNSSQLEENWLSRWYRKVVGTWVSPDILVGPGIANHSIREYLNAAKFSGTEQC